MQNKIEPIKVYEPIESRRINFNQCIAHVDERGMRLAKARISGMHQATFKVGGITREQLEGFDVIDEKERKFRVRLDPGDLSELLEDRIHDVISLMTKEVCLYMENGKVIGVSRLPEYK